MERRQGSSAFLVLLVFLCIVSAGCLSAFSDQSSDQTISTTTPLPATQGPDARQPAAEMSLQLADLPPDYLIRDRTVTAYEGVGQLFRDLGWQQGYRVTFYRLDRNMVDLTVITQEIAVYPQNSVKDVYSLEKENLLPPDYSATDYQVPFPQLGDRSVAWRMVRTIDNVPIVTYTVIFTKKNVYEKIELTGTSTDYETLKTVAQSAAAKIR